MARKEPAKAASLPLSDLPKLHGVTKALASLYQDKLLGHLDTLGPLFRPRRMMGDYIEGSFKEKVFKADRNFAQLRKAYEKVAEKPFGLRPELSAPLESVASEIRLYERESVVMADAPGGRKAVLVRSPLTWVITYPSLYSPAMLRDAMAGRTKRDDAAVKDYILRALLISLLFEVHPGLGGLLEELRFRVSTVVSEETFELPQVRIAAPLSTARPDDETLVAATAIAGRDAFDEVLDLDSVRNLSDPIEEQASSVLHDHGVEV